VPTPETYEAFISYARAPSTALASQLQTSLERFAKPWNKMRAVRVFRDDQSMAANTALWSTIERGLRESSHLILLVTPESAASEYVGKEIGWWIANKGSQTVLLVLQHGSLEWDRSRNDFTAQSTVPQALRGAYAEEPRWVDLTLSSSTVHPDDPRFTNAVADLSSAVRGIDRDVLVGENVAQHRKTMRMARAAIVGLSVLLVLALGAGVLAFMQRNEAQQQSQLSLARLLAGEGASAIDTNAVEGVQKITVASALRSDATQRARNDLFLDQLPGAIAVRPADRYVAELGGGQRSGRVFVGGSTVVSTVGNRTGITDATTATTTTSDDAVVVTVSDDGARIALWHPSTEMITFVDAAGKPFGGKIGTFEKAPQGNFSSSGNRLVLFAPDETRPQIQNWDVTTGARRWADDDPLLVGFATLTDDRLLVIRQVAGRPQERRMSLYPDGPDTRVEVGTGDPVATMISGVSVVEEPDQTYALWDVLKRRRLGRLDLPAKQYGTAFVFSGDQKSLLAAGKFGARIFHGSDRSGDVFTSSSILTEPVVGGSRPDPAIAINYDGTRVALATADGIRLIPVKGTDRGAWQSEKPSLLPAPGAVRHLVYTKDGTLVLSTDSAVVLSRPAQAFDGLGVDDDRGGLSARSSGSGVTVAKFTDGALRTEFERDLPAGAPSTVTAFDPTRMRVAMTEGLTGETKMAVFALQGAEQPVIETTITEPRGCPVAASTKAAFSPSGRYVAIGYCSSDAQIWDLDQRRMVAEYHGEQDDDEYVLAVALDEGRGGLTMALIATSARTVVDGLTGTERSREDFVERQSAATIVGSRFATVSWKGGNLHVYSGAFDAGKAKQQAMFPVRQGDAVALSADGATVAARSSGNAEAGNTIRVWRLADGQEVFSVRLPESLGRSGLQFLAGGSGLDVGDKVFRVKVTRDDVCGLLDSNMSRDTWNRVVGKSFDYVKGCPDLPIEGD
jgi:WD40 repeat protein